MKDNQLEELGNTDNVFQLTWPDKELNANLAYVRTTKTLRPNIQESVDFDTTQNLYIEGDNLDALKLLQNNYAGKIKMIYIDPPYNTGKDSFIYNDRFAQSKEDYYDDAEVYDEDGYYLQSNPESSGRFHTNWLNMMYPRLILARDLLSDDGVIFISIDDNEIDNCKKICNEIFGEENFINLIVVVRHNSGASDAKFYAPVHDYSICFVKDCKNTQFKCFELTDEQRQEYKYSDDLSFYKLSALQKGGSNSKREDRPNLFYPIYYNPNTGELSLGKDDDDFVEILPKLSSGEDGCWSWSKDKFLTYYKTELIVRKINGQFKIFIKMRLEANGEERKIRPKTVFFDAKYSTRSGSDIVNNLFDSKGVFAHPKPVALIKDFMRSFVCGDDIVLDFFSGSATTAHAVMQLNAEDNGQRKFIMVQLPELCAENTEAYKQGYKNICEIGKERIRRAGKKIREETGNDKVDVGFRVLKISE